MKRSGTIDALRFLAALSIVLGHLSPINSLSPGFGILLLGGIPSSLFLAMSGFISVATSTFWRLSAFRFALHRASRLYPPHWLAFALLLPIAWFGSNPIPPRETISTILWWASGMHNFAPAGTFSQLWNFPAWTLTPLLVGGFTLPILKRIHARDWKPKATIGSLLLLCLIRFFFDALPAPPETGNTFLRHSQNFPHVLEVFAGAFAAIVLHQFRDSSLSSWLARDSTFALALSLTCGGMILALQLNGEIGVFYFVHTTFLPIGLLLVASAWCNSGRFRRLTSHPLFAWGGDISIWIWLLHVPVNMYFYRAGIKLGVPYETLMTLPVFFVYVVTVLCIASAIHALERLIRSQASTAPPTPENPAHAAR